MTTLTLPEYQAAERELAIQDARRGWRIHATVYAAVIPILVTVNLLAVPQFLWFVFPLLGWGLGLTLHYLFGYRRAAHEVTAHQARIAAISRA